MLISGLGSSFLAHDLPLRQFRCESAFAFTHTAGDWTRQAGFRHLPARHLHSRRYPILSFPSALAFRGTVEAGYRLPVSLRVGAGFFPASKVSSLYLPSSQGMASCGTSFGSGHCLIAIVTSGSDTTKSAKRSLVQINDSQVVGR